MKAKLATAALLACLAAAVAAAPASAEFGLKEIEATATNEDGSAATQAGSHPYAFTANIAVNTTVKIIEGKAFEVPEEEARDVLAQLPPGLVANPSAVQTCSAADFAFAEESACPNSSVLGIFNLTFGFGEPSLLHVPIYNLAPPPGSVARLGFRALGVPVTVDANLLPRPPYNVMANSLKIAQGGFFYRGSLVLWGNPASPAHDAERGECGASDAKDLCPVSITERPFTLLPRSCTGPLPFEVKADSWQHPGIFHKYFPSAEGMSGCSKLAFSPQFDSQLSTDQASSPTGLAFNLNVTDPGLENPEGNAVSDIKRAEVTLPKGVTINPSQAEGLLACSKAQLAAETPTSAPGEGCPEASKVGSVEVETPLLESTVLKGGLFVATPHDNLAENSLIALYMTIKSPERGVDVNLAGKVVPDPKTGQLVATFDDLPQLPFAHFRLRFREGGRSALISPPACGTYTTVSTFTPWANPNAPYTTTSSFQVSKGVNGAPCPPPGAPPFDPGFEAGSQNNAAGQYSPFAMRLTRPDGNQDLTRFSAKLPLGVLGRLAGTSQCSAAQIATAKANTGIQELRNPSCPSGSKIGDIRSGAGVGSQLTYVPGSLYLAGPFNGAPISVVGVVPAVAGPFDLGTVVVQVALRIDPRTAEVSVDGNASDPIPHFLAGIPLSVKDIQVNVDKPNFTLNPTSCAVENTVASIWGGGLNIFSSADDVPVLRAARYQAAGCAALGFKPSLDLKLKGGTRRGAFPSLRAVVRPRAGDANIETAVTRLPSSAFLEQGHFGTICTRVQYAAKACPAKSVYGHVRAFTPLLSEPLEGPVYLRSSNHNLPDLVFSLHGLVDFEAIGRIDSKEGGIRATFAEVPDAPIEKVVLQMQGGKKGLIVNSTNICRGKHRVDAPLTAHNGKRVTLQPLLRATGCGKKQSRKSQQHKRARAASVGR
jgi:hypothetical protein